MTSEAFAPSSIVLSGSWTLRFGPCDRHAPATPEELETKGWPAIPATVPGNVELDLLAAGRIPDPEIGGNIHRLRPYEACQWWYSREFQPPALESGQRAELVFDGLDCFGTIWVNRALIGKTDNMLIAHRFDVTDRLKPGRANTIEVRIDPAVIEARKHEGGIVGYHGDVSAEGVHVRKAPHMFGWDILPRLVSAGLWRDVCLEIVNPTRFRTCYWMTTAVDVPRRTARLQLAWEFETDYPTIDGLTLEISLRRGGRTAYEGSFPLFTHWGRTHLALNDADFWWPRGYGDPALYDAVARIVDRNGKALDENRQRIGVRTADLVRSEITTQEDPGEFLFRVNGEPIFIRGTNWVPLDALHSRDPGHLRAAFALVADLNCNLVRCWGGNVYEDDDFFDLCDENGILVWQDFAFACSAYPQNDDFAAQVTKEAVSVVRKLRRHPSLVLWCGNNENDSMILAAFGRYVDPNIDRISREILPRIVWEFDPLRPYLPSSPYRSEKLRGIWDDRAFLPEVHLWGPRGYYKAPFYTQVNAHFVSEIGYHGCPCRASLERMFDPPFVYPWKSDGEWNDQWQTKAVRAHPLSTLRADRNELMRTQVKELFGACPKDLDEFIFASQATQAEAMKFFVEFWRMGKFRRTGIAWWNLRDGWPVVSDAVVDFYGNRKLAYEYIKRVQRDVCVMIGDAEGGVHPVVAVNDTREAAAGTAAVRDADSGKAIFDASFRVPANGRTEIGAIPARDARSMWLIEATAGDAGNSNHYLNGAPPFSLADYRRWFGRLGIGR